MHRQTGQFVALKELEQQRFSTHKFLRELRFLLSLQHPNIVTCQALEHTSTGRCLVMDYCEGGTLRGLMSEENRLSVPHGIKLIADILAGLEHAHSRDIVHCDIKPENILLNVKPTGWIARISDFGVARLSQELSNQEFGNTGSPAYMAPERFYGQYSRTSDLYSVGILLFELMVGRRPFSGTPADLMSAHLNQPVKIPDTVPDVWRPLIITALQKLSARRFRTAADMLIMLRSIASTEEAGVLLNSSSAAVPLFQSSVTFSASPFLTQHQEELQQPLIALAVQPPQIASEGASELQSNPFILPTPCSTLYRAETNQVAFCEHLAGNPNKLHQTDAQRFDESWGCISYSSPIQTLLSRPQGCFVVTQRSLHLISQEMISQEIGSDLNFTSHPVLALDKNYQVAIDYEGNWLTTLTMNSDAKDGILTFWQLAYTDGIPMVSRLIEVNLELPSLESAQLIALDSRHIAVVLDLVIDKQNEQGHSSSGSSIQVLTRRGTRVGALYPPVRFRQFVHTLTPYRYVAIDRDNPRSILSIDLKPYRVLRLSVEIEPLFLLATTWGYVAASAQGKITCLDREGHSVGSLLAPAKITAIAITEPHELLVATWDGQRGCLHSLDVREADLELLF